MFRLYNATENNSILKWKCFGESPHNETKHKFPHQFYHVSNVSKYQNFVSNAVHSREISPKNNETFCTLDQVPKVAISFS
jgi:hypothetical protein